jgi:hypothetical protein
MNFLLKLLPQWGNFTFMRFTRFSLLYFKLFNLGLFIKYFKVFFYYQFFKFRYFWLITLLNQLIYHPFMWLLHYNLYILLLIDPSSLWYIQKVLMTPSQAILGSRIISKNFSIIEINLFLVYIFFLQLEIWWKVNDFIFYQYLLELFV